MRTIGSAKGSASDFRSLYVSLSVHNPSASTAVPPRGGTPNFCRDFLITTLRTGEQATYPLFSYYEIIFRLIGLHRSSLGVVGWV